MVADIKIKFNTINATNYLKKISRKTPRAIKQSLARVSQFGIKQITEKTQKGQKPDGGRFEGYASSTKKSRQKRTRQTGFVDLTDTGQMFNSLAWTNRGYKNILFFRRNAENKKAAYHDYFGIRKKGGGKVYRPFFSIGRKDEIQIQKRFAQHYFRLTGLR